MITLILVIFSIALLILVHECGHFFSARFFKIKVEEFGFGFPPRILSRVKNGIRYSLNLLPLGGFVKIFGEQGEGEYSKESFASRPAWQRAIVLVAGVAMNVVCAWLFFSVAAGLGLPEISENAPVGTPVSVINIAPGSPAEKAGIAIGDILMELRSSERSLRIESEEDVRDFVAAYRGEEITMLVKHGGDIREIMVTPRVSFPDGEGPLGIAMARLIVRRVSWLQAPLEGAKMVAESTVATFGGLWDVLKRLVIRTGPSIAVSGPVGIFFFARDAHTLGASFFLQFVALLSLNLGILNILPIPALDGGRILFVLIEKLRGVKIDAKIENMIHAVGFIFLIFLMIVVTYKDIVRIL